MRLPQIDIAVEAGKWPDETILTDCLAKGVAAAGKTASLKWPEEAELSVVFTDDAAMTELNGQWRNKPNPTNVLSFPGGDVVVGEASDMMIGDLVFAFETVQKEALEQGKDFENHLLHLIVHGYLHLFGYDHLDEQEAEQMEALEIAALAELGIDDPYKDD